MDKSKQKKFEKEVEAKVEKTVSRGFEIFFSVLFTLVFTVLILKFVWAWTVGDLFPGAVEQGLIAEDLSWGATLKLSILVALLNGVYHSLSEAFMGKS